MNYLKLLAFPFLLLCVLFIQSCQKDTYSDEIELDISDELDCFFSNDCIEYLKSKATPKEEKKEIKE